ALRPRSLRIAASGSGRRAMYSDDVEGRARVKDTPALERYYAELEEQNSCGLWQVANAIEPWEPRSRSQPVIWKYRAMRPLVLRATELVSPQDAARRVVAL